MSVPFLDLQAQYQPLKAEIAAAMQGVLDSSAYVQGPAVERFERDFAAYCGAKHCIAVNSGTSALALLMQAHGIGTGDEVITVTNSFIATAEAISHLGAIPVLVDCRDDTALMDASKIEERITDQTKAIIPVHLYGQVADMDAINSMARKHGLFVFEDACQAHGATLNGRKAGGLAHGAAFSFYPGKNLGAYGEGGAVTTDDDTVASQIRMLRDHGSEKKYHHAVVGWNERMDGIQGAVLNVKLPHLDGWNAARRAHAARYRELLPKDVRTITQSAGGESSCHLFVVRVKDRNTVQARLNEAGIQTGIHYPIPIHLQPAYAQRGWKKGDFPVAETLAEEILSLPLFPELADEQIQEVCAALALSVR